MSTNTEIKVKLCSKCNGSGVEEHSELVCYHRGDYDYWTTKCTKCDGAGRVEITTIVTTEIKIKPFFSKIPRDREK